MASLPEPRGLRWRPNIPRHYKCGKCGYWTVTLLHDDLTVCTATFPIPDGTTECGGALDGPWIDLEELDENFVRARGESE